MVGFFPVTTFEISFLLPGLWAVYIRSLSFVLRCSRTYQMEDPEYNILRIMLYFLGYLYSELRKHSTIRRPATYVVREAGSWGLETRNQAERQPNKTGG